MSIKLNDPLDIPVSDRYDGPDIPVINQNKTTMTNNYYKGTNDYFDKNPIRHNPEEIDPSFYRYVQALSPGNPYLRSLSIARGDTYYDTLQKAIQWESDQFAVRQEMSFNSTSSQVARDREAGFNPDLMALGSGSGSGGSSIDVPVTDTGGTTTGAESRSVDNQYKVAMVDTIGGLVNQSVSTLTDSFATMTGAVQSIKNFQNQFAFNQAQAKIAGVQAGFAEQMADNELLYSNLTNSKMLAEMYPYAKADDGTAIIPSLDEVTKFLSDYGIDDPRKAGMVHSYMNNPRMKGLLDSLMEESTRNHASALQRTHEYYNALYKRQGEVELLRADSNFYLASIDKTINSVLSGDESFIQNLISDSKDSALASSLGAQNDVDEQRNRTNSLKLIKDMLKRDHDAFKNGLIAVNEAVKSLDQRRESLASTPQGQTTWGKSLLSQLWAERNLLTTLGSQQLHQYCGIYSNALRQIQVNNVFHGVPVIPDKDGKASDLIEKRLQVISYSYDHFFNNPTSFDKWFTPVVNGVVDLGTSAIGLYRGNSTPPFRMKTTSHFGDSSRTVYDYGYY